MSSSTVTPRDGLAPPDPVESSGSPVSPLSLPANEAYFSTALTTAKPLDTIIEHVRADHGSHRRHSSISSISFKPPGAPSPQARPKAALPSRKRDVSPPPPCRFQRHVSFDNFAGGEPTEWNTISFTLNMKHKGYQFKRRSRTFMVGIDENDYSDIALQWMLEELVDDGDEIICLRVIDKDSKITSDRNVERKQYQKEAKETMDRIQSKNDDNRAISIVLEYAVGKVESTFQKMIQLYEPAMLIVGTRGRSLGGIQGLINTGSFSKWCLQHSPIPVVVVRPTEKRMKKKKKRDADPVRQEYARILRDSGVEQHETEYVSKSNSIFEEPGKFEKPNDPDAEAHAVALALNLPPSYDPTLKPTYLKGSRPLKKVDSGRSDTTNVSQGAESTSRESLDSAPSSPGVIIKSPKVRLESSESPVGSGDESSDDDEGEFDVADGRILLGDDEERLEEVKKKRLHEMEVGEAAALMAKERKRSSGSVESSSSTGEGALDDEDDDDEDGGETPRPGDETPKP